MDCKDLMVGDWVICNHYQDKPFTKQFGVADFAKGEYEFCEPIPLTEEILVKNGFVCERNVGYIFDDYEGNEVIYDDYNNRLKILQNHDVSFNREYFSKVCVHHLQHALRLCEIRKEIEL